MSTVSQEDRRRRETGIDYKDLAFIGRYVGPQGQILSRRRTGFSAQRQRELKKAIKRARHIGLLPFVG